MISSLCSGSPPCPCQAPGALGFSQQRWGCGGFLVRSAWTCQDLDLDAHKEECRGSEVTPPPPPRARRLGGPRCTPNLVHHPSALEFVLGAGLIRRGHFVLVAFEPTRSRLFSRRCPRNTRRGPRSCGPLYSLNSRFDQLKPRSQYCERTFQETLVYICTYIYIQRTDRYENKNSNCDGDARMPSVRACVSVSVRIDTKWNNVPTGI